MTEYIITGELVTKLKSEIGTAIRDAIESGMTEYSEQLRELLGQLDARPIIETPAPAKPELSQGWQVTVSYETTDAFPYVTEKSRVVGAIAELLGADLADSSVTIEELEEMVEDVDGDYGVWSVPLKPEHVAQLATGEVSEFLVNHPMGGLIYIAVEQD